ncbi:hypothetical protein LY01_02860 [Nonlabens xylanidelens]|uniref:DUF5675 domain-containing protein n=1 Tax=Nonlabens xylanidelens TaxID=191564 RepID=A0A2S6IEX4_9FLAO|nr:DUF5675 family protein [Nonlabens xylanidelens]PPK92774.1 hypothetical protein LY01_02860 [Nonlabens xylanidelens]PQJ19820.1 hypothetical protein BST94_06140 [Nonlabens xylanidelens]
MNVLLHRTYYKEGTNSALFYNGLFLGFAIELPWLNNQRNVSCIAEGVYELKARYSAKFKHHLYIVDVKGRSLILLHSANNAKRELRGCIAPVTQLTGIGKGINSKPLLQKLVSLCYQAFDRNEKVLLTIKS